MSAALRLAVAVMAASVAGCGAGGTDQKQGAPTRAAQWLDPDGDEPVIGALAVDPGDGAVWLSTNRGLYRVRQDAPPRRVSGVLDTPVGSGTVSSQLVIAFTAPGELVASGHPASTSGLPEVLGLIRSRDGARRWTSVSELGAADFHTIESSGNSLVAAVFGESQILVSANGGRTWRTRAAPAVLVDLAVDPGDDDRWAATTRDAVYVTTDAGRSWRPYDQAPNARLAWAAPGALYRIDPNGRLALSADGGRAWKSVPGRGTGGEPRALTSARGGRLYVALLDGSVKLSPDAGRTWRTVLQGGPS